MQPQPIPPGEAIARINPEKAIELIQAQIAGVKKEIADLTGQLVPGTSDARENAIDNQLSAANERLESLQSQLDRVVSGDAFPVIDAPPNLDNDIPRGVQNLVETVIAGVVVLVLGFTLLRIFARRIEARSRADTSDANPRLERLEQAIDSVAIEVERVSEGQRYANKLLGELRALPAPNPMEQWPGAKQRVREGVERSEG